MSENIPPAKLERQNWVSNIPVDKLEEAYDDLGKTEENMDKLYENLAKLQQKLTDETLATADTKQKRKNNDRYVFEKYTEENKKKLKEIRDRWVIFFYDLKRVKELYEKQKTYVIKETDPYKLPWAIKAMGDLFPNESTKRENYYFTDSPNGMTEIANKGFELKEPMNYKTNFNSQQSSGTNKIISENLYEKYGIDPETNFKEIVKDSGGRATMKQRRKKRSGKVRSKRKPMKTNRKYHRLRK